MLPHYRMRLYHPPSDGAVQMRTKNLVAIVFGWALLSAAAVALATAPSSTQAGSPTVIGVGSPICLPSSTTCYVDITVTPGTTKLAAVDVFVDFNAAVLTATAVTAADNFGTCYVNPYPDTDTLTCSLSSVDPGLSGTVATISFAVIGATGSTSQLHVSAFSCVDENLTLIACTTVDGLVTVGPVTPTATPLVSPTLEPTPPLPSSSSIGIGDCFTPGCVSPAVLPDTGGSPDAALPALGVLAVLGVGSALAAAGYLVARRTG
jgi:hypothetical protein